MRIHYLEIVCRDVDGQCAALKRVHGLSFGPAVADLGQARAAEALQTGVGLECAHRWLSTSNRSSGRIWRLMIS